MTAPMAAYSSNVSTVISLLNSSLNSDPNVRGPAEASLYRFQSMPGFCSSLMEVVTRNDLATETNIRLVAAIFLKNSINRHWRSRGISNEEKMHLRKKLLSHMREGNDKIAEQLAVIISKIARFDYPVSWPDLFSVLIQQLQSADVLASERIVMITFRTLKELSTKRLAVDQRKFEEITSEFFEYCWHLWKSDANMILQSFSAFSSSHSINVPADQEDSLLLSCERWFLCSKIMRQLLSLGFPSDAKSVQVVPQVKEVCPVMLNAIQSLLPFYFIFRERHSMLWQFVKKTCVKLMKSLIVIQHRHPFSVGDIAVLPSLMDFCLCKILAADPDTDSFEQFLIQCMVMIKSLLECKEYKLCPIGHVIESAMSLDKLKYELSSSVNSIIRTLLPDKRITVLCNVLVRRYFVLKMRCLEEWDKNAEAFHLEQDVIQWTEKLRPCAEALYIVLFENYGQLLGPVIVSILREATESCPASETDITPKMLFKDAAYAAAGHACCQLSHLLSLNDWFNQVLFIELSNDHPNMRVIHRRIALLLGQCASELNTALRKLVCHALTTLLNDKDLAVKLAACRSVSFLIEEANFHAEDLAERLPACLDLCFNLVLEVNEFDSKVQVIKLISLLIEHMGNHVIPCMNKLVQFFQKAWEETIGESLLQIQLLNALRNLVTALGYSSSMCYSVILPILQTCVDINSSTELNLLEDGLLLWEDTVFHAPSIVPQLMQLFCYLPAIINSNIDQLKVAVEIFEGYVILGGMVFLSSQASHIAEFLTSIVANANDKGLLATFPIIELMIQCFPTEAPPLLEQPLQELIVICLRNGEDYEPSRISVKAYAGAVLARLLVMNSDYLLHLTTSAPLTHSLQHARIGIEQNVILSLADVWLDKIDNVTATQKRCCILGLSSMMTFRAPGVLDKLDYILSTCTSALGGVDDSGGEYSSQDTYGTKKTNECAVFDTASIRDLRIRQIKNSDPIKQLSLEASLRENLQSCIAVHGEMAFNAAIGRMHPTALKQLQQAINMS